jgi:hypothetical protein
MAAGLTNLISLEPKKGGIVQFTDASTALLLMEFSTLLFVMRIPWEPEATNQA